MATDWYYADGDKRFGPVAYEQLVQLVIAGRLDPRDLVWNESMTEWSPAGSIPGLFQRVSTPPDPPRSRSRVARESIHDSPDKHVSLEDEATRIVGWIMGVLDVKFQRHYTMILVRFIWIGYLLITAFVLAFCLLSIFIPNTVLGLVSDVATTFYDPSRTSPNVGSGFSGRIGVFIVLVLVLGFIGLNVRVALEILAVQFRIADFLKEMNQARRVDRLDEANRLTG